MARNGWIKLHRCLLDKPIFNKPDLLKTFLWCICTAYHSPHKQIIGNQIVDLEPGQFSTGRMKAGTELGMEPSKVWRHLKTLEKNGSICIKSYNKYSVVTIANWELYQSDKDKMNNKMNNKRTTDEQQMHTNKNVKNVNNEKNVYNYVGSRSAANIEKIFETWNEQKIIQHKDLTPEMVSTIDKALAKHSADEIETAIQRYAKMLKDQSYQFCQYKWTLINFLSREKGYTYFMDNGEKWINYTTSEGKKNIEHNSEWMPGEKERFLDEIARGKKGMGII